MEGPDGGNGWRDRMEGMDGGTGWRDRMEGPDGGTGWRDQLEGPDGGTGWRTAQVIVIATHFFGLMRARGIPVGVLNAGRRASAIWAAWSLNICRVERQGVTYGEREWR